MTRKSERPTIGTAPRPLRAVRAAVLPVDPAARAAMARQDRSVLDFVRADAARLGTGLGAADRRKNFAMLQRAMRTVRESHPELTLVMAGLIALVQTDIKRVLAYSTM